MITSLLHRLIGGRRASTTRHDADDQVEPAPEVDDRNARYDRETAEVIRRVLSDGDAALDIGANEGSILRSIVAQSPNGPHHAFEPIPGLASALRESFPTVTVHQCALAAQDGESNFHHVVSNSSYSGLRERRYDREGETIELITVPIRRLDGVVPVTAPIRLIKIDVEGGELGVLQGGLGLIDRQKPVVVFEHGLGGSDYYGTRPEDVLELFDSVGYSVTLMERWLAGDDDLTRHEFLDEFATCRNYYFLAHPR